MLPFFIFTLWSFRRIKGIDFEGQIRYNAAENEATRAKNAAEIAKNNQAQEISADQARIQRLKDIQDNEVQNQKTKEDNIKREEELRQQNAPEPAPPVAPSQPAPSQPPPNAEKQNVKFKTSLPGIKSIFDVFNIPFFFFFDNTNYIKPHFQIQTSLFYVMIYHRD